jgi:hypothetical protein
MGRIKVSYGFTKNMGNYQSARADIGTEFDVDYFEDDVENIIKLELARLEKLVKEFLGA